MSEIYRGVVDHIDNGDVYVNIPDIRDSFITGPVNTNNVSTSVGDELMLSAPYTTGGAFTVIERILHPGDDPRGMEVMYFDNSTSRDEWFTGKDTTKAWFTYLESDNRLELWSTTHMAWIAASAQPNYAGSVLWWYDHPYPYLDNFTANVGQTFNLNAPVTIFDQCTKWPMNVAMDKRTYQDSLYNATYNTLLLNPIMHQAHTFSVRWQLNTTDPNLGPGLMGLYSVNGEQRDNTATVCRKGKIQIIYQTDFAACGDIDTLGASPGMWLRYIAGEDGTSVVPVITSIRRTSYAVELDYYRS